MPELAGGPLDEEEEQLPPLAERKILDVRRILERTPIKGGPSAAAFISTPHHTHQVFFGNLHSHTSYSDGSDFPADAFAHARDVAGLDFLAVTEHNHSSVGSASLRIASNPHHYEGPDAAALITVDNALTTGTFVALYGEEFSSISSGNHLNVFDEGAVERRLHRG